MAVSLPDRLRLLAHRSGWVASPSLAFQGVPFGPEKRDLAGEVMANIAARHDPAQCLACARPDTLSGDVWL